MISLLFSCIGITKSYAFTSHLSNPIQLPKSSCFSLPILALLMQPALIVRLIRTFSSRKWWEGEEKTPYWSKGEKRGEAVACTTL